MNVSNLLSHIRHRLSPHKTLIEVGISRENLLHNLHTYQAAYPELSFAPVLKSNAYGHGLVTVARLLDAERIAFFMVDSIYEARTLREHGIRSRILVMGYVRPEEIAQNAIRNTEYALVDIEQLRALVGIARRRVRIHLKIDTGMHRHGILPEALPEALDLLKSSPDVHVVGIGSHFSSADDPDPAFTKKQIARWNAALDQSLAAFPNLEYQHLAATKGIAFAKEARTNVARLGIGLYGFDTSAAHAASLRPVLELRSIISSVRAIIAGESVGYNAAYTAGDARAIATIPAGYFEGVDRRLSNKGSVLVHGRACPIVGRVSMNMTSVDVTDIPNARSGDAVTVVSRDPSAPNSVSSIAKTVSSGDYHETEYVILTHIPPHLKRVVE